MKKNLNFVILFLFVIATIATALSLIVFLVAPDINFVENIGLFILLIFSLVTVILLFTTTLVFLLTRIERTKFSRQLTNPDFFTDINNLLDEKANNEKQFKLFLNSIIVTNQPVSEHIILCAKEIKNRNAQLKKLLNEKNTLNNNSILDKNNKLQKEKLDAVNRLKDAINLIMVLELKLKKFEAVEKKENRDAAELLVEFNKHKKASSTFQEAINDIEALFVNFKNLLDNLHFETQSIILLSINFLIEANKLDVDSGFIVACTKLRGHVEEIKKIVRDTLYENENLLNYTITTKNTLASFINQSNIDKEYTLDNGSLLISQVIREIDEFNTSNKKTNAEKELNNIVEKQFFYNNTQTEKNTVVKVEEFDVDDTDFGKY
jgi:hypothetical protein